MADNLEQLYEQMKLKEHKDLEEQHPDVIEALMRRIEMLESKVHTILEGK